MVKVVRINDKKWRVKNKVSVYRRRIWWNWRISYGKSVPKTVTNVEMCKWFDSRRSKSFWSPFFSWEDCSTVSHGIVLDWTMHMTVIQGNDRKQQWEATSRSSSSELRCPLSCHVMSLRRRRFATVGCADGLVPTNALCLVRCVAD